MTDKLKWRNPVAGGIIMNTVRRIISGAKVTFDIRRTDQVEGTRSTMNKKSKTDYNRRSDREYDE